jgi:sterol desaturase/sphingolipid hydroxylase (fatty acid hydroxylase superfamily)
MDVTTGARFHPIEILISFLLKCVFVVLLGVSAMAILIFEIILNGLAMFNHSNIQMPKSIDKVLRILVVTPDMHRVHHSVISEELNTNYGFNLSVWDRIFGTYLAQPSQGHQNMTIGLRKFQNSQNTDLSTLLIIPFIKIKL